MSRYLPTSKTLTNPTLVKRLLFILLPLLDDKPYFPSRHKQFTDLYHSTKDSVLASPIAALQLERDYHEELLKHTHNLKDKVVIYLTGISVDQTQTGIPRRVGTDLADERNRLYSEIQQMVRRIDSDWKSKCKVFPKDLFIWVPVAHLIHPYVVNEDFSLVHYVPQAVEVANRRALTDRRRTFGDVERHFEKEEFRRGNYLFSPALFDPEVAKKFYPEIDESELETCVLFNRYLLANAYANFISGYTSPESQRINIYAEKGSYAFNVMKTAQKILDLELYDFDGIMRNADMPQLAECDPSSLRILEGFLRTTATCYK